PGPWAAPLGVRRAGVSAGSAPRTAAAAVAAQLKFGQAAVPPSLSSSTQGPLAGLHERPTSGIGADSRGNPVLACDSLFHISWKCKSSAAMGRAWIPFILSIWFVGRAAAEPQPVVAPTTDRSGDAQRGPETAGMDRSVKPGDDFFMYANGAWFKSTTIAADK